MEVIPFLALLHGAGLASATNPLSDCHHSRLSRASGVFARPQRRGISRAGVVQQLRRHRSSNCADSAVVADALGGAAARTTVLRTGLLFGTRERTDVSLSS